MTPPCTSLSEFRRFRDRLDTLTEEASALYADKMQCRAGCSACCRGDFRISVIEALAVRQAVAALPAKTRAVISDNLHQNNPERCPLLVDQQCSIYAERPVLCRIFGFPVTDGETVATCELNFTDEQSTAFTAKSFHQPTLSDTLTLLSRLYLEEVGQSPPQNDAALPTFLIQEVVGTLG